MRYNQVISWARCQRAIATTTSIPLDIIMTPYPCSSPVPVRHDDSVGIQKEVVPHVSTPPVQDPSSSSPPAPVETKKIDVAKCIPLKSSKLPSVSLEDRSDKETKGYVSIASKIVCPSVTNKCPYVHRIFLLLNQI
jgi:hypothetical protein